MQVADKPCQVSLRPARSVCDLGGLVCSLSAVVCDIGGVLVDTEPDGAATTAATCRSISHWRALIENNTDGSAPVASFHVRAKRPDEKYKILQEVSVKHAKE